LILVNLRELLALLLVGQPVRFLLLAAFGISLILAIALGYVAARARRAAPKLSLPPAVMELTAADC